MGRPPSPTLITLGRLVRTHRDAAGLLQRELAGKLGYSDGWLSNLETGQLRPRRDQVVALEETLNLPSGALMAPFDQLDSESLPVWFRPWLEEEARAEVLRSMQLSLVPGMLQTEEYARALMPGDESAVNTRMERQRILDREDPPRMHFVIDEAILYRERGGPEVMRAQLEHLMEMVSPRITIQIVRSKDNPCSAGAFVLATVDGSGGSVRRDSRPWDRHQRPRGHRAYMGGVGDRPGVRAPAAGINRVHPESGGGEMDVTGAEWRKARRSAENGGECVEIAALWRKARRSGQNGGECVEVAVWEADERSV